MKEDDAALEDRQQRAGVDDSQLIDKLINSSYEPKYNESYIRELVSSFKYQTLSISGGRLRQTFEFYMTHFKRYTESRIYATGKSIPNLAKPLFEYEAAL